MEGGLPDWLNTASVATTLVGILWLWLSGRLKRAQDCDDDEATMQAAHDREVEALKEGHRNEKEAWSRERQQQQARLDAVIADRDMWREAQKEEVGARRAAEAANANLAETTNIAMALLGALKEALEGKGQS